MHLIDAYRDKKTLLALISLINKESKDLKSRLNIMEVCGGHTHTLMKYALKSLISSPNINFIHGPGCPVCVMPKSRISEAFSISMLKDVILVTLGDMIKVPGHEGSLAIARAKGADIRVAYSPLECLKIAKENQNKKIVYFAIGFETTTPMSAALLDAALEFKNLFLHINHVLVPPPVEYILNDKKARVNALIAPSHVSVITGSKIYEPLAKKFQIPIVVSGFEPVDMCDSILRIIRIALKKQEGKEVCFLENEYKRLVSFEGNSKAQSLVSKYFELASSFTWRGLGEIKHSSLKLKEEYKSFDAEVMLSYERFKAKEDKSCLCGNILKGLANPKDCKVFGNACTPSNPLGSCMVSSEGACSAYYKYGALLQT